MALTSDESRWLEQYRSALNERFPDGVSRILLYGSKARGTDRADSDVDVLVIIRGGDWTTKRAVAEVGYELSQLLSVDASIIVRRMDEWAKLEANESPFWQTVSRDAVIVA